MRFEVLLTYTKSHDLAVVREPRDSPSQLHPLCTGETPVLSGESLDLPLPLERTPPFVHREDPRAKW